MAESRASELLEEPVFDRPLLRVALSWLVHVYTASGAVLGMLALRAVAEKDAKQAFLWLFVALVVDSTDGWLARRLEVRRLVPRIDGRRLDDVVDYFTYVIVPFALLWQLGYLPREVWVVAMPLVASGLGFANEHAKTEDDFFLGFPSYWNVVAFYLWLFGFAPWTNAVIVIVLSVMVLLPTRYIYPSKTRPLQALTLTLCTLWCLQLVWAYLFPERTPSWWLWSTFAFPTYYVVASFVLHILTPGVRPADALTEINPPAATGRRADAP